MIPAAQLVDAFNDHHRQYRAEILDKVVVIRPVTQRAAYLDSGAPIGELRAQGLIRIAAKIFAPLDPTLDAAGGRVGSVLGPVGIEIDRGENIEIERDLYRSNRARRSQRGRATGAWASVARCHDGGE